MNATDIEIDREVDEEWEIERLAEVRDFNAVYADYLEVQAKLLRAKADKELDKLANRESKIIWQVIRTLAVEKYQLAHKFEIMRRFLKDHDDAGHALLESIRHDAMDAIDAMEFSMMRK